MNGRVVCIHHQTKFTLDGKKRPTLVLIVDSISQQIQLATEDEELQFILSNLIKDDCILMLSGGSGDYLSFAIARLSETIGANFLVTSMHLLLKNGGSKEQDIPTQLYSLHNARPDLFHPMSKRDLDIIWLRQCLRMRIDAMEARMACEQRIWARTVGSVFCSLTTLTPEVDIKEAFARQKATDDILGALMKEEGRRNRDLKKACEAVDVYRDIFAQVEGCGPAISSRIIAAVGDVNRFSTLAKFKAFCGTHVLSNGQFARRRNNQAANWNPDIRQALYLLGDQFNRRPNSYWGQRLREAKEMYRIKHPKEVVGPNGKRRYTDGHIHKMAIWYVLSKFTIWLYYEWKRLDAQ